MRVRFDARNRRTEHADQLHILANQPPQHLFEINDDVIEIKNLGFEDLFATKSEELPRQRGGAFRGLLNLLAMHPQRVASPEARNINSA